jgi:hypothetical protein
MAPSLNLRLRRANLSTAGDHADDFEAVAVSEL